MGFLDKVKASAEQAVKQGQDKLEDVQAKKKADGLLRDLGAWYYATQTGRDEGKGEAEIARLVGLLNEHEAEHGQLGAKDDDEPAAETPEAPTSSPPPPASSPPPPVSSPPPPTNSPPPPV